MGHLSSPPSMLALRASSSVLSVLRAAVREAREELPFAEPLPAERLPELVAAWAERRWGPMALDVLDDQGVRDDAQFAAAAEELRDERLVSSGGPLAPDGLSGGALGLGAELGSVGARLAELLDPSRYPWFGAPAGLASVPEVRLSLDPVAVPGLRLELPAAGAERVRQELAGMTSGPTAADLATALLDQGVV